MPNDFLVGPPWLAPFQGHGSSKVRIMTGAAAGTSARLTNRAVRNVFHLLQGCLSFAVAGFFLGPAFRFCRYFAGSNSCLQEVLSSFGETPDIGMSPNCSHSSAGIWTIMPS